jgi:hypothetical protein
MAKYGECEVCGTPGIVTEHHKIKRGQQSALIKCQKNLINLCNECHYSIHHGKNGHALDMKLQLEFQNFLEENLLKQYFSREEIKAILKISWKETDRLCKTIKQEKGMFTRESIIRTCMGGKIISEEDIF